MLKRLPVHTFDIPLPEIRRGYYSASYFGKAKRILELTDHEFSPVTMQVFQRGKAILCGIDEAIAILKTCTGYWSDYEAACKLFDNYVKVKIEARKNPENIGTLLSSLTQELNSLWVNTYEDLEVEALGDGYYIFPWEPVLKIRGKYSDFAHLESVYLGVLARSTRIATNVSHVVEAARGKPVLFFADRFDRYNNQTADGYAAHIGGAAGVASDTMGSWWGADGMGTMPHALVAMFDGSPAVAAQQYHKYYPDSNVIALVDYNNNCVADSLKAAHVLGTDLWGVRLDTSGTLVDVSVPRHPNYGLESPTGVNPMLVEQVRNGLDKAGFNHVMIVASGGFNVEKITRFEQLGVPVDSYAVGSSLLSGSFDYTADIVSPLAKVGRKEIYTDRLTKV